GGRGHEGWGRKGGCGQWDRLGQKHVDDGRDADGDRDAMVVQPVEEARLRKLAREDERGARLHRRPDRQDLRRGPAEVAVVEDRVALPALEPVPRRPPPPRRRPPRPPPPPPALP